ncbi:MAG TPA: serine hydrolase [Bacteroides sp.]|nr:serine hydrolase [Bacteroides sp.]
MKNILSFLILPCLLMLMHPGVSCQKIEELDLDKLDKYIEEARLAWQVPGLSVAIVKDDSVVFARGYGSKEYGKPGKVDENTIFSIASITKTFTSSALALLDDQDKIDWDDPVGKYLPDFVLYDPYVSKEIRIRDLLCHRSGLKTFSGDLIWYETGYSREEVLNRTRYLKPAHGFRYEFGYSNLAFLAAGEIVPAATGISWDAFVESEILKPLGMNRTFMNLDGLKNDENVASPHHVNLVDDETYVLPYMKWDNVAPAASMNSSAMDLTRWIRFQLELGNWNDKQLISSENLWETRELHTSKPPDIGSSRIWPSMHFAGYGLGWELYDYHGWKVIAHEGGSDGMLTRLVIVPEEDFGFVMLTNSISALTIGLEYYILDQYYAGESYDWCNIYLNNAMGYLEYTDNEWNEYIESADRSQKPSQSLRDYTGTYSCDLYGDVEVSLKRGSLVLDFVPSDRLIGDLTAFTKDTFLIDLRDMPAFPQGTVKFELDNAGVVSGLEVYIPSPDFDFTELELRRVK